MSRREQQRRTGTRAVPDLWHFGEGGTLGANLGVSLLDLCEEPIAPDNCETCGKPTGGLLECDDCLDRKGVAL